MAKLADIVATEKSRAIADAELQDPVKREEWLLKWHEAITSGGEHYKTLRGFVIAQVRKSIKDLD